MAGVNVQRVGRGTPERRPSEGDVKPQSSRTSGRFRSRLPFFQRISPPSGGRAIQGLNASAAAARSNKFSDKSLDRRDPLAGGRLLELPDDG